jgi:hypothetical protein
MCELQQGITAVFSVSGALSGLLNVPRFSAPIPVIDDTDVSDTLSRKKCPGALRDPQIMTLTIRNLGTAAYPAIGVIQDLTLTYPLYDHATPEIIDGPGFVVDVRSPEFGSDSEGRQTVEIDWQYNGDPLPTRTLAT